MVSPDDGSSRMGRVSIAWVSSLRSAGGRSTTSSTSAVMLSLLPAASAASTSVRAVSSGEARSSSSTCRRSSDEHAVNAVAADQQPIMLPQADRGIVDAREILEADGAVEHMGEVAASGDVILGQPLQTALAQTVGAGVADVNDVTGAARQDHRRERAAHAAEPGIDAALRIDPAIGGLQRARGDAPDAQRFGQGIVGVEKTAHGQFGGFPSALVAADAIRHRGNDVAAECAGLTEAGRDVVFVGGPLAGLADEADANLKISLRTDRHVGDLPSPG